MPYYVYVLRSLRNGKRYVGMTSKPPDSRLREHNSGSNRWTSHNRPFELVHAEQFETRADASQREPFLKSGAGRKITDRLVGD